METFVCKTCGTHNHVKGQGGDLSVVENGVSLRDGLVFIVIGSDGYNGEDVKGVFLEEKRAIGFCKRGKYFRIDERELFT